MSKKRKNAGEGYGYMFSGAFAKKADAMKKEATRKGSFIKGVYVNGQHRYAVMTPRTNPIKRRKASAKLEAIKTELRSQYPGNSERKIAKAAREQLKYNKTHKAATAPFAERVNPAELVVLGANPSQNREINLPAGSSITIRVNPTSAAICGAMIGGEECSRKPGHRGPHLPQGATMRPRSRLRSGWKPRASNPSAEAIRESFTGREADKVSVRTEPHMPAGDYAQLGELLALYVKPTSGGQVMQIKFQKPRPVIVSDETARQLYFVGGDQDLNDSVSSFSAHQTAGLVELGEARRIDYKQRKEHVPDPANDEWRHEFGEESGVRPQVLYDRHNKRILLEGGEYVVRAEGIVN